ncbi:stalk domain-containing protein [Cohnella suwonensis]|uniref:Stalk domain-containing protein n=1 Tax=Cohnella suwonensis TaxID=696072 RepID=A0ABW0M260_9BACL
MRKSYRKSLVPLFAVTLVFSSTSAAYAAGEGTPTNDGYNIVALGDSIGTGYEPGMNLQSVPYGYVERVYEQALFHGRSELDNYAILGLTTPGLANFLQAASENRATTASELQDFPPTFAVDALKQANDTAEKAPELGKDLAKADLVVLTIGANDFGEIVKAATGKDSTAARQIIQDKTVETMNKYTEDLDKTMILLHKLAPDAQIVLADQYLPLMPSHELYADLDKVGKTLSETVDAKAAELTAAGVPVKVAHVFDPFQEKSSSLTHFNAFDGFDIHPSQAGYETIAKAFSDVVWYEYRTPAPRPADVVNTIVINGKETQNKPVFKNGTNFLAITDLADAIGANWNWDQKTKSVTFSKNGKTVVITIGAKTIVVDGSAKPLATPAYFQQIGKFTKTYVPLAVVSDSLDYQVVFRNKLKTAFINL